MGFVAWANDPVTKENESILVKQLKDLGAIILCKTYVHLTVKADEQERADCNDDA